MIPAPAGYYATFAEVTGETYTRPVVAIVIMQDDADKTERWTEYRVTNHHGDLFNPVDETNFVALRWANDGLSPEDEARETKRAIESVKREHEEMLFRIEEGKERKRLAEEREQQNRKAMEEFNERNRKAREEAGLTTPTLADRLSGTGTQQ
jgi:hypothetical protein